MRGLYLSVACIFMAAVMAVMMGGCTEGTGAGGTTSGDAAGTTAGTTVGTTETRLNENEIKLIFEKLKDEMIFIEGLLFNGYTHFYDKVNPDKTIPSEPLYLLTTDPQFKSIADIRTFVEKTYTLGCLDRQDSFYNRYMNSEHPLFKEYNDELYIRYEGEGHGFATDYLIDTLIILNQGTYFVEFEITSTLFLEPSDIAIFTIKLVNGKWLTDCTFDESYVNDSNE